VMDDLRAFRVPVLILSGGEPLLRPDIFDIAKRAKKMGFYVGLSTNGTLIDAPMAERTLINVNFPAIHAEDVKGIRVARQGFHDYSRGTIVEGRDPRGYRYFWFGLDQIEHTLDHGTDLEAIEEGFVAVTPLQLDLTHYSTIGILAERFAD